MMTAELIDSQLAINFLKCPGRIKTIFLSPGDNSRLAILCKRATVERKVSRASESEVQPRLVCRVLLASKKKSL